MSGITIPIWCNIRMPNGKTTNYNELTENE